MPPELTPPLTMGQVKTYAAAAGFKGQDLNTAVAVAFAESKGYANAHNGNAKTGDNSYGLWQINMIGSMGPARRKEFGIKDNTELYKPETNARAAYQVYKDAGNSFQPWSTYKHGTHKQYLDAASKATPAQGLVPGVQAVEQKNNEELAKLTQGNGFLSLAYQFTETVRKSSIMFMIVLIALVFLIVGVLILNGNRIGKIASVATPVGRAASVVGGLTNSGDKVVYKGKGQLANGKSATYRRYASGRESVT